MTITLRPFDKTTTPPPQLWEGHLKLEQTLERVDLIAVYPTGQPVSRGCLLSVTTRGLYRQPGVIASLGLPRDDRGCIALESEPDYPARIAELEAEVARLNGSEAPPDKGAWLTTAMNRNREGRCLHWDDEEHAWFCAGWRDVPVGSWVREQPPPPPGGGA